MQAMSSIVPLLVMFGIFYLILIRPQVKKQKDHQAMLQKLGKGDEVITRGGVIGKITGVSDDGIVVLELQEKVRVRVPRAYIEGRWDGKVPASVADLRAAVRSPVVRRPAGADLARFALAAVVVSVQEEDQPWTRSPGRHAHGLLDRPRQGGRR
jgi:preprotein translocase subunit YajC